MRASPSLRVKNTGDDDGQVINSMGGVPVLSPNNHGYHSGSTLKKTDPTSTRAAQEKSTVESGKEKSFTRAEAPHTQDLQQPLVAHLRSEKGVYHKSYFHSKKPSKKNRAQKQGLGQKHAEGGRGRSLGVHNYLHQESLARAERHWIMQQHKALTFQPKLATNYPSKGRCRGAREAWSEVSKKDQEEEKGVERGVYNPDVAGAQEKKRPWQYGEAGQRGCTSHFERLYQNERSRHLKASEDASEVYRDCTFKPTLVSAQIARKQKTSQFSERLHKRKEEHMRVWELRKMEREAREVEGCTFSPFVGESTTGAPHLVHTPHQGTATSRRLYSVAAEVAAKQEATQKLKEEIELEGCTFHPEITSLLSTRNSERQATLGSCSNQQTNDVFQRLSLAAKESQQRQKLYESLPPPGCTFHPHVNSTHGFPPQYLGSRGPRSASRNVCSVFDCSESSNSDANNSCQENSNTDRDVDRESSSTLDESPSTFSLAKYLADNPLPNCGGSGVGFMARTTVDGRARGDKTVGKEEDWSGAKEVEARGRGDGSSRICAASRLYQHGVRAQRQRNRSPHDPRARQRARDEEVELALCTFRPETFTAKYRGPGGSR
ncbi:unnamed protein product [Choristocarpus tenellus]